VICFTEVRFYKPTPRWGGHKDRISFNPFSLSNGHLDRVSFSPQSNRSLRPSRTTTTWCLLLWLQRCWEQEWGRRKAIQAIRTQMHMKVSLSKATKCLEWIWIWRGFDLLICVLKWSLELLYWMQWLKTWMPWSGGGWGYVEPQPPNQPLGLGCCRWAHRTVRCASHVTQPLGFDRWSSDSLGHRTVRWCTIQSLFTVWCAFWRCSNSTRAVRVLFTFTVHFCRRPLAQ
jgi:hypothetical protein